MAILTGIYSVTVVVDDQDRALAFYRDVLGCEVLHLEGSPPMFTVPGSEGNTVILMQGGAGA